MITLKTGANNSQFSSFTVNVTSLNNNRQLTTSTYPAGDCSGD